MALATGFSPFTDEELDFIDALRNLHAHMHVVPVDGASTICGPCFEGECEKSRDIQNCVCCAANHVA